MKSEQESDCGQGHSDGRDSQGAPSAVLVFQCGTAAMECVRQYISEVLDFMADMHTLTKLKVRGFRWQLRP